MGNSLSRSRYLVIAREALEDSTYLREEVGVRELASTNTPRCFDAIVRYLEGRFSARDLVANVSPLEVSITLPPAT